MLNQTTAAKTMIGMIGGTNGFGAYALERLSADPGTTVLLGAGGENQVVPNGVGTLPLDLASIESTSQFTAQVIDRLDGQQGKQDVFGRRSGPAEPARDPAAQGV